MLFIVSRTNCFILCILLNIAYFRYLDRGTLALLYVDVCTMKKPVIK